MRPHHSDISVVNLNIFSRYNVLHMNAVFVDHSYHVYVYYRSSRLVVFCEKGVLKIFAKFTGKHRRDSLVN